MAEVRAHQREASELRHEVAQLQVRASAHAALLLPVLERQYVCHPIFLRTLLPLLSCCL